MCLTILIQQFYYLSSGIELVLSSTLYKFIVWVCLGYNPILYWAYFKPGPYNNYRYHWLAYGSISKHTLTKPNPQILMSQTNREHPIYCILTLKLGHGALISKPSWTWYVSREL